MSATLCLEKILDQEALTFSSKMKGFFVKDDKK
jgi:hypothetical protein